MHRFQTQLKIRLLDQNVESIRPLNDTRAIETGANFLGESIIFAVAGSVIIWESWRSNRKNRHRNMDLDESIDALENAANEARASFLRQSEQLALVADELRVLRAQHDALAASVRSGRFSPPGSERSSGVTAAAGAADSGKPVPPPPDRSAAVAGPGEAALAQSKCAAAPITGSIATC